MATPIKILKKNIYISLDKEISLFSLTPRNQVLEIQRFLPALLEMGKG